MLNPPPLSQHQHTQNTSQGPVTFGFLCAPPSSSLTFGVTPGSTAILCTGIIEASVDPEDLEGDGSEGDIVVRVSPVLDDETATSPVRVEVKEVTGTFPFSVCEVEGKEDEDGEIDWDEESFISGMLDLMVDEACASGVEEEMTSEEVDDIIECITGEWGAIVSSYSDISYTTKASRRWHMACDGMELLDLDNTEVARLVEMGSGVGRMVEIEGIVRTRVRQGKLAKGAGVDLEVSKVLAVPEAARMLKVGDRVQYYWNEEYEWCEAEVVGKEGPVGGEFVVELRFVSDGEVHKVSFGGEDKARWRPVEGMK